MIRHILVALDLTDASKPALKAAFELASPLGAMVTVLHVSQPPFEKHTWFVPFSTNDQAYLEGLSAREREATRRILDEQVREVVPEGVRVETLVKSGVPSDTIVETARGLKVELIVTGTHGRKGLRHALLGSVAERVVRTAPCSVMTVHAPA
jgi:universal stress protein A